jgi:hypothetical protein
MGNVWPSEKISEYSLVVRRGVCKDEEPVREEDI